jgi:hypothetical protein
MPEQQNIEYKSMMNIFANAQGSTFLLVMVAFKITFCIFAFSKIHSAHQNEIFQK